MEREDTDMDMDMVMDMDMDPNMDMVMDMDMDMVMVVAVRQTMDMDPNMDMVMVMDMDMDMVGVGRTSRDGGSSLVTNTRNATRKGRAATGPPAAPAAATLIRWRRLKHLHLQKTRACSTILTIKTNRGLRYWICFFVQF
ncbi:uncharacterized protein LOC114148335 isoform X3 [Xiphophorus couchianus]|uniref:uncharacterized protein LOC114148335 isoform X3 n=1 Tax=Xiphophorus couchianus TaxID=32473 RepID=UPI0010166010|nr:uncharacterized protein LOC114148335 isoform X3 [Xiphophorus couchianus]